MLRRIERPDAVLAYRAVGKAEKSDYETVLAKDEVRFVYVLGDDFDA
jgi:hypothetical protein